MNKILLWPRTRFTRLVLLYSTVVLVLVATARVLTECTPVPPTRLNNICNIFSDQEDWYAYAKAAADRWGVPVAVQMAILYQESRFRSDAKTPRRYLLGFIPWFRRSSAYGYAQVQDGTWARYRHSVDQDGASRDDFADAVDFVGWYCAQAHRRLGLSRRDTYHLYLAYHEGLVGYRHRSYAKKPWLKKVARSVSTRAHRYELQLSRCAGRLNRARHRWWFW